MSKNGSRASFGRSGNSQGVSSARLRQQSGTSHSFGGYTKVNKGGGNFTMRPTSAVKRNSGK